MFWKIIWNNLFFKFIYIKMKLIVFKLYKMKLLMIKFIKKIWNWILIWIWIILSVCIFWTIYAYTSLPTQNSWDTLTESIWNNLILEVNEIWEKLDGTFVRNTTVEYDSSNYSAWTSWVLWPSFSTIPWFKAGSKVKLYYHMPMRNDSGGWWWAYLEPQISFDWGSTWNSLWSSWYDWGVMVDDEPAIGTYNNTLFINPEKSSDFSVTVRFYFRSYSWTVYVNKSHDINTISSTENIMNWINWNQHFSHIIVEEIY